MGGALQRSQAQLPAGPPQDVNTSPAPQVLREAALSPQDSQLCSHCLRLLSSSPQGAPTHLPWVLVGPQSYTESPRFVPQRQSHIFGRRRPGPSPAFRKLMPVSCPELEGFLAPAPPLRMVTGHQRPSFFFQNSVPEPQVSVLRPWCLLLFPHLLIKPRRYTQAPRGVPASPPPLRCGPECPTAKP